jgi:aspartyl-tRNA(Asn)/glutamyl-tRNA(Gln) amidotransferase subunit A
MLTIHASAAAIRAGRLTPVDLLEQCLERIDRYEPHVRAWVVVDRDGAREQAERLTDELRQGLDRGPLHGIAVGVKDIIDVFDLPTGCGSKLWANSYARQDAAVVARLRQAGAVILGKTVTTPYAFIDPPVTRNPWDLGRTPGGSSSGSAAAVACGMCLGALGTQTAGSITRPAAFCGVCSLKPTYGVLPVDGVLPLAGSLDHVGPFARCVRDLAILLGALEGRPACGLGWTFEVDRPPAAVRFSFPRGPLVERAEPPMRACLDGVWRVAGQGGAEVAGAELPATFAEAWRQHRTIMAVEAAAYHGPRLHRRPEDYPPRIRSLIEDGLTTPNAAYRRARDHQALLRAKLKPGPPAPFLVPAAHGPPPDPSTTGDAWFSTPWSYLGLPAVSLPAGRTEDALPLAVQLVGAPSGERALLAVAAWLEKRLGYPSDELPPVPG